MKEKILVTEYAQKITEMLPKGILLNTKADRFDSMVIGWGAVGTVWSLPAFTAYVRKSRYTKEQLDKNGEFTVSVPLELPVPLITRVCGSLSARDVDKVKEAGLTLEEPELISVPGVKEYPLTLECRVLYSQEQVASEIPEYILERMYPLENGERDLHTAYIGQIVNAYIIR